MEQFGSLLFRSSDGALLETAKIAPKKYTALFFGANYCAPCHKFTPLLSVLYEDEPDEMEVIFVSRDATVEEFTKYVDEMPWLAVPFESEAIRDALQLKYSVSSIPQLTIIETATGVVMCQDARALIAKRRTLTALF